MRAVGIVAVVVSLEQRAAAQEGPAPAARQRVRLEYRAPPECADTAGFRRLVGSRLPQGWEDASGDVGPSLDVEISGAQNGYVATLELLDERGERVTRTVRGELCASVADAIALITALAIQSRATTAARGSEPAPAPASVPTAPPADRPEQAAARRAARAPNAPRARSGRSAQPAASLVPEPRPSPGTGHEANGIDLRVSARAALSTGVGPNAAPGAALGLVFELRDARLGVALQAFRTARVSVEGAPIRFELLSARLEACPFVVEVSDSISIEPCPLVELGAITGEAFEQPPAVVQGERGTALWLASGATGRAVGRFGAFVVELEAGLGIPLRRERFYVEGRSELYQVPGYYGALALGVGVRF